MLSFPSVKGTHFFGSLSFFFDPSVPSLLDPGDLPKEFGLGALKGREGAARVPGSSVLGRDLDIFWGRYGSLYIHLSVYYNINTYKCTVYLFIWRHIYIYTYLYVHMDI